MQVSDLIVKLQAALMDSAEHVSGHEQQLVEMALADFSRYRPHQRLGTIELQHNQACYPAPVDLISVRTCFYGQSARKQYQPWERGYPRDLPNLSRIDDEQGKPMLRLSFLPGYHLLNQVGWTYSFSYYAARTIQNDAITIDSQDEPLLLLRAIVEAVKYIAVNHLSKTVSVRNSIGGEAKNGTPAAIHQQLMEQFERQVRHA